MSEEAVAVVDDNQTEVETTVTDNEAKDPGYMAAVKGDLVEKYGEELRQYQNINPIIEDYFTLKAKSEQAIVKPGEGASEEEVAQYKESMGIPLDAKDYELGEGDPNFDTWFRDTALSVNLDKDQAKGFKEAWDKVQNDAGEKSKADAMETEKAMKAELGSNYDSAMSNVGRILEMGGEGLKDWLNESGAGNDPRMVKVFMKLGALVSEDSIGNQPGGGASTEKSLADRLYPNQGK